MGILRWLRPESVHPMGMPPFAGTPIHIVDTYEESTPHLKGWTGWPGDAPDDGLCDCRGEACVGERLTCQAFGPLEER